MSKSVRYKLNKVRNKKTRRKNFSPKKVVKKSRGFKFFKILGTILIIVLLGYWLFVAYKTVTEVKITDVVGDNSEVVDFVQTGKVRKTLIIYENPQATEYKNVFILAVIYNTDTSEALIYHFPSNLYINDYFANKQISIANLTYAGNSYMYDEKYAYVVRQIEEQMAIKFDSYVRFGSEISKNFVSENEEWGYSKEDVESLFSKLSFFNLIPKYYKVNLFEEFLNSNMSFLEMYNYFQDIRGVVISDNYKYIDLSDESMSKVLVLPSGRNVKSLMTSSVDISLRENISVVRPIDLAREHVKVEVYNATDISGYARVVARRIFNAGCRVIRHENSSQKYEQNHIYVSNMDKFVNGLGVVNEIVEKAIIVEGRPDFLTTGDIVVVLGSN